MLPSGSHFGPVRPSYRDGTVVPSKISRQGPWQDQAVFKLRHHHACHPESVYLSSYLSPHPHRPLLPGGHLPSVLTDLRHLLVHMWPSGPKREILRVTSPHSTPEIMQAPQICKCASVRRGFTKLGTCRGSLEAGGASWLTKATIPSITLVLTYFKNLGYQRVADGTEYGFQC